MIGAEVHARSALSGGRRSRACTPARSSRSRSTTIIAKAFEEQRVKGKFTDIVFGVLIIEDLIGIFLIAILTAISAGTAVSTSTLAVTGARLATFLAGLIGVGLLIIPRAVRAVVRPAVLRRRWSRASASASPLRCSRFRSAIRSPSAPLSRGRSSRSRVKKVVEASRAAGARHVRRDFLRVRWGTHRPGDHRASLGRGTRLLGRRDRREGAVRLDQLVPDRVQSAHVGPGRDEPRPDRRVLVHHCRRRAVVRRDTRLSLPRRRCRLGHHRADDAVAHPRRGACGGVGGSPLPAPLQTFVPLYGSWIERLRRSPGSASSRSTTRRLVELLLVDAVLIAAVIGAGLERPRRRDTP